MPLEMAIVFGKGEPRASNACLTPSEQPTMASVRSASHSICRVRDQV